MFSERKPAVCLTTCNVLLFDKQLGRSEGTHLELHSTKLNALRRAAPVHSTTVMVVKLIHASANPRPC